MALLMPQLTVFLLLGLTVAVATTSAMSRSIEIDSIQPIDILALGDRLVQLGTALGSRPRNYERPLPKKTLSDDLRIASPRKRHCWDVMDLCCILNAC